MDSNGQTDRASELNRLAELAPPGEFRTLPPSGNGDLAAALEGAKARVRELEAGHAEEKQELARAYHEVQFQYLRYKELFESAPDGYVVTDLKGIIEEANHTAVAMFRSRKEFLKGKPLPLLLVEGRKTFYDCLSALRRTSGSVHEWEAVIHPPQGLPRHVAMKVSSITDDESRPARLRWVMRDITARKQVEQSLEAEKDFADCVVETAQALILVIDARGTILRFNPAVRAVSHQSHARLQGRDWAAVLLPAEDQPAARNMVAEALRLKETRVGTFALVVPEGPARTIAWSARVLAHAPVKPAVLLFGHDITELQQAQAKALQAERLAAIGKVMANLAHESRNALQRSQACLERLSWKLADRPEALDLLARAQSAQEDLVRLFEDVRGYASPVNLKRERWRLDEAWRDAWTQVSCLFPGRDAQLTEETDGVDPGCSVDRFRVVQVFRNILENSFAACAGSLHVTIACDETVLEGRPALWVRVLDDGPGLSAEQAQRIFEPFYTTKVKGTGLGMAIAQRIIQAHGGLIAAGEATEGGAEIVITLPKGG